MSVVRTYFCIVGKGDIPVFEVFLNQGSSTKQQQKDDLVQFVIHSAIDLVEQKMATTTAMRLQVVDKFQDWNISAFVTAANVKFMLLHDQRIDETATKSFFSEAYEAYVKAIMNPFHEPNSSLATPSFEEKIKTVAKKYFPR